VPQDIGRVLLNLINNAFQACAQSETENPLVTVKTKRTTSDEIRITVTDNGPGIPSDIKDKIFQPFFTTKPTGEGTGLGLSLSYDILKAHGGELTVESELRKGSSFFITLPT
jgi:signal transduction histidine kinase